MIVRCFQKGWDADSVRLSNLIKEVIIHARTIKSLQNTSKEDRKKRFFFVKSLFGQQTLKRRNRFDSIFLDQQKLLGLFMSPDAVPTKSEISDNQQSNAISILVI